MKKTLLLLCLCLFSGIHAFPRVLIDGIYYDIWGNDEAEVTHQGSYGTYSGDVVIPATIVYEGKTYNVTKIGFCAFMQSTNLTSVVIPEGVKIIDFSAFNDCENLTSVNIPESVTLLGQSAFAHCYKLTSFAIPSNVTAIPARCFEACNFKTFVIGKNVSAIGEEAFVGSNLIERILCLATTPPSCPYNAFHESTYTNAILYVPSSAFATYKNDLLWNRFNIQTIESLPTTETVGVINYELNMETLTATVASLASQYITTVNIPSSISVGGLKFSVTSIKGLAFSDRNMVTSVSIPETVTNIGDGAFSGCTSLTSVNIPEGVTSIGTAAFQGCSRLTSITIPEGVTSLGESVFSGCTSLTAITIPKNVTFISWRSTFSDCTGLKKVTLDSDAIVSEDRRVNTSMKSFFGDQVQEYIIGNNVTSIGANAFLGCEGLTSVTIPKSVTFIGYSAFSDCKGLTEVHITDLSAWCNIYFSSNVSNPNYYAQHLYLNSQEIKDLVIPSSVTSIGKFAFVHCIGLTSITIPASVTSIGNGAFMRCTGLTAITIPASVTALGDYVFENCTGLTDITIPKSVTSIGNGAFKGCTSLTAITIPASVTSIGNTAFYGCTSLTSVTVESDTPLPISENTFSNRANATLYVPYGSKADYEAADYWNEFGEIIEAEYIVINGIAYELDPELTASVVRKEPLYTGSVNIPSSVTYKGKTYDVMFIAPNAFSYCNELTDVIIPNSVTYIGASAFNRCVILSKITIPNSVTYIGKGAFERCSNLTSIVIPNKVKTIYQDTFYKCSRLASVVIPRSVTAIEGWAFDECPSLTSVYVDIETPLPVRAENNFSNRANATLYVPRNCKEAYQAANCWKEFKEIIEEDATIIIDDIAYELDEGTHTAKVIARKFKYSGEVTIPSSVVYEGATYNVTEIDWDAFSDCIDLTSVTISEGITVIGFRAFLGCIFLTDVHLPNSLTKLWPAAFYNCHNLRNVNIPEGITEIDAFTFYNCYYLPSIIIPSSVKDIGPHAFYNCKGLKNIICYAEEPPTVDNESDSRAFAGVYIQGVELYVPDGSLERYRAHEVWGLFKLDSATGIQSMEDGRGNTEEGPIFNLSGQRLNKMQRGINIVNGRKVLVK